jgi:replicative DNA helicase
MARTALDHSKVVLGAILPNQPELLHRALDQLTPDHFPDPQYKALFMLMERYIEQAGGVLTKAALVDQLAKRNVDAGKIALYETTYDVLASMKVDNHEFKWSVEQLKELVAAKETAEAITTGMEILNRGTKGPKGEEFFGHNDARSHVLTKFAEIDRALTLQESPEGDSREETDEIWEEINNPQVGGGINFGIPDLDDKIDGLQRGELDLVVGYTSSGKSTLSSTQLPWSAAIEQGKNVVILTTETLRPQIRRRLISRHSRLSQFGLDEGINSKLLRRGIDYLPPEQARVLPDILDDYKNNPLYGKLVIVQVPRNATISSCEGKINRYQREFDVDLVVIDSINLLKPDRRFSSRREELAATLQEAKQFATTFADGRGVPVVSPWQTNRDSWKEAQSAGYYNSSALAETSEASSSSDVVITILEPMQKQRYSDIKLQVVKNRDGETVPGMDLVVDYATSYWSQERRITNSSPGDLLGINTGILFNGGL